MNKENEALNARIVRLNELLLAALKELMELEEEYYKEEESDT